MAIRLDVFDRWWASVSENSSDQIPTAEPNAPLRVAAADLVDKRDGQAGK